MVLSPTANRGAEELSSTWFAPHQMKTISRPTAEPLGKAVFGERSPADEPPAETPLEADAHGQEDHDNGPDRVELARIGFVALAVALSWLHVWRPVASFDAVAWGATQVGGYPIFKEAFSALLARRRIGRPPLR